MSWQALVHGADGVLRATLTPDDPVDSLWWSCRGDGDNVEAVIRGAGLDLRPRDIVRIDAAPTPGAATTQRFWGWVVETADPRARDVVEVRLVGGSSRLREVLVQDANLGDMRGSTEVASMALAAAALGTSPPPRLTRPGSFPATTFKLGSYATAYTHIAQVLEDLALTVPGFTVEPGSSYTYDGKTFNPGDVVPPVTWGTRPTSGSAEIFWRRATTGSPVVLDEVTDGLRVEFEPFSAEALADRVLLLLVEATQFDTLALTESGVLGDNRVPPVPVVHRYASPGGKLHAARAERIPALDGMVTAAWMAAAASSNMSSVASAFDASGTTYAYNTAAGACSLGRAAAPATRGLEIHYSSFVPVTVSLQSSLTPFPPFSSYAETVLPSSDGAQKIVTLLTPFAWAVGEDTDNVAVMVTATADAANDVRVYNLRGVQPDKTTLDRMAKAFVVDSLGSVATVVAPNRIITPTPGATITLGDGSTLTADVGALEYSITRERGLETLLRLNHSLPAGAATTRALLDARIRSGIHRANR